MKYALVGYGRMGRAIDELAKARGHECGAVVDPALGGAPLEPARLGGARMAFEFSLPEAAETNVLTLLTGGISVVCGTTGWKPSSRLRQTAEQSDAGFVLAPNFSVGMQLFFRVVKQAAQAFGALGLHDPFVQESHHRGKVDAPSGTARKLASIVVEAVPGLDAVVEGNPAGRLPSGSIQVVSTRAGSEPGTHRVGFDGPHEVITLEHRARDRTGLALGAVLAAEWLEGRRGLTDFAEVVDAIMRGELRA